SQRYHLSFRARSRKSLRRRAQFGDVSRLVSERPNMQPAAERFAANLEKFRHYLRLLAGLPPHPRFPSNFDPPDVVQQTLLEAYQNRDSFKGNSEPEWLAWLRQVLAHNLADALRHFGHAKRDLGRERSLEEALQASSLRLQDWLAAEQSSPSQQ